MRNLSFIIVAALNAACFAQDATPKKIPFEGFGNTGLDQRPKSYKLAPPAPPVSGLPPKGSTAPISSIGSLSSGLSFDAKTVSNGGGTSPDSAPSAKGYASPPRSTTRVSHPVIEVNVRNLAPQPANAHFEWFFVATDLQGRARHVWDQGQRDVAVLGGSSQHELLESTAVAQQSINRTTATNYVYTDGSGGFTSFNSTQEHTGLRPDGWIVRMFVGGALVKVQGSTDVYEQIGRDPVQLDTLLHGKRRATPVPMPAPVAQRPLP